LIALARELREFLAARAIAGRLSTRSARAFSKFALVSVCVAMWVQAAYSQTDRPNIVLMIGDDIGFSDLSPYGGDIDTPNLATLAAEGVAFTNYHTPPACSPSRAQLHTGVDHHLIGLGRWDYAPFPGRDRIPGYEGYLTQNNVTTAELLRDAGYSTFIAGKWHQGHEQHTDPYRRGFEQSFVLLEGGASNYNNVGMTANWPVANFTRNGKKVRREEGAHSDKYWTDELIKMIDGDRNGKPFYAVLSFQTAHFPLQAPDAYIDKYQRRLSQGWQQQRRQRLQRLKELGLLAEDYAAPDRSDPAQDLWSQLSDAEREFETKRGAVYAAMIEHHDHHIGRLMDHLRSIGEYDNTLFIYASDNGGAIADFRDGMEGPRGKEWFAQNFNNSIDYIGTADSNIGPGFNWGMSSNTPHSWHKLIVSEGGINVPMIVRHPKTKNGGRYSGALTQAMDIAATVLATASTDHPGTMYKERDIHALQGRSLLPILSAQANQIYADDEAIVIELLGNSAAIMGDWKLMRVRSGMGGDNQWQLFRLSADPQESTDLRSSNPDMYRKLMNSYKAYAAKNNIKPTSNAWTPRPGSL